MPKIKPYERYGDIHVKSFRRKRPRFHMRQDNSYCYLWIDGNRIRKTRKGTTYYFHVVDGKIDHFFSRDPGEGICKVCEPVKVKIYGRIGTDDPLGWSESLRLEESRRKLGPDETYEVEMLSMADSLWKKYSETIAAEKKAKKAADTLR